MDGIDRYLVSHPQLTLLPLLVDRVHVMTSDRVFRCGHGRVEQWPQYSLAEAFVELVLHRRILFIPRSSRDVPEEVFMHGTDWNKKMNGYPLRYWSHHKHITAQLGYTPLGAYIGSIK